MPRPMTATNIPTGRDSFSSSAYKPLRKDHLDFSGVDTGTGAGEYGLEVCARRLSLERSWWLDMRSLWAFMFALPAEMTVTIKAWNQQAADQIVSALAVTPAVLQAPCQKTRTMTGDSSSPTRFFVSNGIQGTQHLGFRWALGGLLFVGIRSDTGEELIDSAGA